MQFAQLKYGLLLLFSVLTIYSKSQSQTDTLNKKRLYYVAGGEFVAYSVAMTGLYSLWYKDYASTSFHWFDDHKEWLQMDKAGHYYSSYLISKIADAGFEWSGLSHKKAVLWGSGVSFVSMSGIELFDGFSAKWGASYSDLIANTAGICLYAVQELTWQEQKIIPKFSYHNTIYPKYRPDALGKTFPEKVIKDYNGQTNWLSFNIYSLTHWKKFPEWLNVSFGYGAEEMLGGLNNELSDGAVDITVYERYRQYYVSLDIDFTRINTKSKALKSIFNVINLVKLPFPAVEINKFDVKFHPIYF
ncbi:MAG: DUF2279 domain-containing protein [Marinilabiliales bacterium]